MADGVTMRDLPRKLDYLLSTIPGPDGGRFTLEAVAREMGERDVPTTPAYLSLLRNGNRDNPSFRMIAALAAVFGVPVEYFVDDPVREAAVNEQIEALKALRDSGVQGLVPRGEIDTAAVIQISALLGRLQRKDSQGADDPEGRA